MQWLSAKTDLGHVKVVFKKESAGMKKKKRKKHRN